MSSDPEQGRGASTIPWYFYLARCADSSLYSGITNNIRKREELHNAGRGSKYVRSRLPVRIIYFEQYANQSAARLREIQIKKWSKLKKEWLLTISPGSSEAEQLHGKE